MKNPDTLNRTILFSQFKRITLSLLSATVLLLLIFLQFQTGQATNQIIFFTDAELSRLGPIRDSLAGPEILYPAAFNDEVKQEDVRVVGLANGTLLVAWDIDVEAGSSNVPADHRDLFGKIYNADGTTVTGDIQLYDYDSIGHSNDVALTPTSDGGFYALWFRSDEIAARKFNSLGIPAGPAQTIISDTVDTHEPEMVELTNGNFMITFRQLVSFPQNNVGTRLYDSALTPLTDIMRTNEMTVSFLIKPNIVPLRNGGSMVSWPAQAGDDAGIFVQVFDANGAKVGGNKQVNTLAVNEQENAQIAPLANGNVVVVYENREIDDSFQSIAGRIIDGLGNPVTGEIQINAVKANGFQQSPDVVGLKDNSWVVVWESFGGEEGEAGDSSAAVLAVHLDQSGTAISDEFVVNQTVAKAQDHPFVSAISGTIPVVVWEGIEVIDTNGDDDDEANLLRETDVWMRILNREPVTTTQYILGKTELLTNTEVSLVGSEEVLTVTVQISANYEQGVDLLRATTSGDVVSNFDAAAGMLTLSGSNLAADYAAAIKAVSFSSTTSADPAPPRTVTWSIYGASGLLDSATMEITIQATNPIVLLTDVELSTLGPIRDSLAGPEILYPAAFNDEVKQEDVRVVGLANGTFLVGWDIDDGASSGDVPADHADLFGKIYKSDGTTVTGDIQLYDYDSIGHSNDLALTPTSDGGFYALWFKFNEVAVRKFNSLGEPVGPAQTIVSDAVEIQEPEMVELTNGNFMLTYRQQLDWPNNDVGARLYDSTLTPLTEIMRTNEMTVSFFIKPNIVPLQNGGSMVSWPAQAGDDAGIFVQVFDANGAKVGGNKQVNTLAVNEQENAQIAPLANGNVVVVYENREIDDSFQSIAGRIIDGLGNPVTGEIQINAVKANGFQQRPDVVGLKDNSWVVVWESFGGEEGEAGGDSAAVLAVHLDQSGTAISDEFVVNQTVAKAQDHPFVSAISGTIPVVVWEGIEVIDTNGDDDDEANLLRETDVWMRILNREPVTTTQYILGKTELLTNTEVSLVGSEEVLTVTVQISANYEQGVDLLRVTTSGDVVSNFDAAAGVLTLSGSNLAADYAAAIKAVSFSSTTSADPAPARTVTWSIYDASGLLDSATMEITIDQGRTDIYLPLVIR